MTEGVESHSQAVDDTLLPLGDGASSVWPQLPVKHGLVSRAMYNRFCTINRMCYIHDLGCHRVVHILEIVLRIIQITQILRMHGTYIIQELELRSESEATAVDHPPMRVDIVSDTGPPSAALDNGIYMHEYNNSVVCVCIFVYSYNYPGLIYRMTSKDKYIVRIIKATGTHVVVLVSEQMEYVN